jgi:hypothetical protein
VDTYKQDRAHTIKMKRAHTRVRPYVGVDPCVYPILLGDANPTHPRCYRGLNYYTPVRGDSYMQSFSGMQWAQASAPVVMIPRTNDRQGRLSPPIKIPNQFPRHSRGLISVAPSRGANWIENLVHLWAAPAVQHS